MKHPVLLFIALISLNLNAQTDHESLNAQLESMSSAFLNEDYKAMADYTYPKILEMMGGKEAMIEATESTMSQMKSQGFTFLDIVFKEPSKLYEKNGDTQCVVTQVLVMETPQGKIQSESTLLAISEDEGENWVFIDSSGMPRASLESLYPNLHPDIEIKASKKSAVD
jgi:hypothetical protein